MAITREQALDVLRSHDLIGLGMEADSLRQRLHPEGVVTYLVEEAIHCAGHESDSANIRAIAEAVDGGCAGIILRSLDTGRGIEFVAQLVASVRQHFPHITLRALSPDQVIAFARTDQLSLADVLKLLQQAGLDSIDEEETGRPSDSLQVHRAAHELGMTTTATIAFGSGESFEQRLDHLEQVRRLQEETGGFAAFVPRHAHAASGIEEVTAVEYLKMLALSRLYLDNVENLQAGISAQGLKVLQMGLRFGINDAGSVAPGTGSPSEEDLRRTIRDAGFQPRQRDPLYRSMFVS